MIAREGLGLVLIDKQELFATPLGWAPLKRKSAEVELADVEFFANQWPHASR